MAAVEGGDLETIDYLLDQGLDLHHRDQVTCLVELMHIQLNLDHIHLYSLGRT